MFRTQQSLLVCSCGDAVLRATVGVVPAKFSAFTVVLARGGAGGVVLCSSCVECVPHFNLSEYAPPPYPRKPNAKPSVWL
jgi:hypothetical protein